MRVRSLSHGPTRNGIAVDVALLPVILSALEAAAAEARHLGLLPAPMPLRPLPKDRTAAARQRRHRARQRAYLAHLNAGGEP